MSPAKTIKKPISTTPPRSISFKTIFSAAQEEATGSKTSSYLATTAFVGLIFVSLAFLVLYFAPPTLYLFLYLFLAFCFAIIFSPLRYASEEFIRQVFPGVDYNSHLLVKRLNQISYSSLTLDTLSSTFFTELGTNFNSPECAFIFVKSETDILIKTSDRFQNLQSLTAREKNVLINFAKRTTKPAKRMTSNEGNQILDIYHIRLLVPLTNNNDLAGLLLLGTKDPQKPYTTKDHKVLEAIAPKIGFAIKNAFAYEKIASKNAKLIYELEEKNEQLRLANKNLRKDDKLKDEFLFISTHELKNPITAMKGYLSLIKEGIYGQIPVKLRPAVEQIDASNEQLITLLNNLLQIARYEAQRLEIKTKPVVICDVINQVIHEVKALSDQKLLQIVHQCPNPAIKVSADKDRLHEIISNLIGNAIKYSDHGVISVTHEIIQDKLITHIQDQGFGIPESDQPKIFTRFFRVQEETGRSIPGSGLGLFIVKKILEKMDGEIWFISHPGVGSTFSFSLPLAHTATKRQS